MSIRLALFVGIVLSISPLHADYLLKQWDGNCLQSLDPAQKNKPEDLSKLAAAKVPSAKAAQDLAFSLWAAEFRIRDYQTCQTVGLYRSARTGATGVAGLAAPGDWIWEVHIGPPGELEGIVLINAETGKASAIPPLTKH